MNVILRETIVVMICIAAAAALWVVSFGAMAADTPMIADYLDPSRTGCDCTAQQREQRRQRQVYRQMQDQADEMEMRQIRIEQRQFLQSVHPQ